MKESIKNITLAVLFAGLLGSVQTMASTEAVDEGAEAVNKQPTVAPIVADDPKGKEEEDEGVALKIEEPAIPKTEFSFSTDQVETVMTFANLIHNIRKKSTEAGFEQAMIQLLQKDQITDTMQATLGMFELIREAVNTAVNAFDAPEGSGCYKCQKGWKRVNQASAFIEGELNTLAELLPKYIQLIQDIQKASGEAPGVAVMAALAPYLKDQSILKDMRYFLNAMNRYNQNPKKPVNSVVAARSLAVKKN